jgi:hypothetical protein
MALAPRAGLNAELVRLAPTKGWQAQLRDGAGWLPQRGGPRQQGRADSPGYEGLVSLYVIENVYRDQAVVELGVERP